MATTDPTFEGFSISHAAILDGTTGAEIAGGQMYGVREGTLAAEIDNFDNTGDDAILSSWFWFKYATISIKGGYVPFSTVALLTGSTLTSSSTGSDNIFSMPLWEQGSLNAAPRPVLIRCPSKDKAGSIRDFDFVIYKLQFQPISFEGPTYKSGLVLDYGGRGLITDTNEKGVVFTGGDPNKKAIGRMVNVPSGYAGGLI